MSEWSSESCFPLVTLLYAYQIICISKIKLGENGGRLELFVYRTNQRKIIFIFNGNIQSSVINAWPEGFYLSWLQRRTCPREVEVCMMPEPRDSSVYFLIDPRLGPERLYNRVAGREEPTRRSIEPSYG